MARVFLLTRAKIRLAAAAMALATTMVLVVSPARAQLQLPGAVPPSAPGTTTGAPPAGPPRPPREAAPMRPRGGEETLPGRQLRFLGTRGNLVITRAGAPGRATFTAVMTGVGRRGNDISNVCTPSLGETVTLRPLGRPAGLSRFEANFPGCRVVLDLLSDAAIASAPDGACRFADDCVVDPSGLWGPVDRDIPADRDLERARAAAERRVGDARRTLNGRLRGQELREFNAEQARFPALREQQCRNYGTTDAGLGFCALKMTEARAAALEARVGGGAAREAERRAPQPPAQR